MVKIAKDSINNLSFGTCSCGIPPVDLVPCIHMSAVVKSGRINGITVEDMMPWWWTTRQWRLQLPKELHVLSNIGISTIKETFPDWTAANKAGRPKKGKRIPSAIEIEAYSLRVV